MNCVYHPDIAATANCSVCGKALCSECAGADGENGSICSRCVAVKAAQDMGTEIDQRKEDQKQREERQKRKKRLRILVQWLIAGACVAVIISQAPEFIAMLNKEEKPIRIGTYQTDARTDQCLTNLWQISNLLQQKKLPGNEIRCPAGDKPYQVVQEKSNTTVHCPTPGQHGFGDIQVSSTNPVPRIR